MTRAADWIINQVEQMRWSRLLVGAAILYAILFIPRLFFGGVAILIQGVPLIVMMFEFLRLNWRNRLLQAWLVSAVVFSFLIAIIDL